MDSSLEYRLKGDVNAAKIGMWLSGGVAGFGLLILVSQCVLWLQNGYWTDIPLSTYIPQNPNMDWSGSRGVEKLWNGLMAMSAWETLFAIGAALFFLAFKKFEAADNRLFRARHD